MALNIWNRKFGWSKSDDKLKAGVFFGPEIRYLIRDEEFESQLGQNELLASEAFVLSCQDLFLVILGPKTMQSSSTIFSKHTNEWGAEYPWKCTFCTVISTFFRLTYGRSAMSKESGFIRRNLWLKVGTLATLTLTWWGTIFGSFKWTLKQSLDARACAQPTSKLIV